MSDITAEQVNALIMSMLGGHDPSTMNHGYRVSLLCRGVSSRMGFPTEFVEMMMLAGKIHDVGKIGISDSILLKPGKLSVSEYEEIKEHPAMGESFLHLVRCPPYKDLYDVIRQHHERMDGSGYPDGLVGEEICIGARILGIADVYDAMTSLRPYHPPMSHEEAMGTMLKDVGTKFDPVVWRHFKRGIVSYIFKGRYV